MDKFTKACAEFMGWEFKIGYIDGTYFAKKDDVGYGWTQINMDDMNQLAEVFDKCFKEKAETEETHQFGKFMYAISDNEGIEKSMRNFVSSCLDIEDK